MPTPAEIRNQGITAYLVENYNNAIDDTYTVEVECVDELRQVFDSKTISYREIILTSLVAKNLDDAFDSHTGFYNCKPRGIYETPIRNFLLSHGFPCTKSGPLNIAKASNIDEAWASQRDPKEDADATIAVCDIICNADAEKRKGILIALLRMYNEVASRVQALAVNISPSADPFYLSTLCVELIKQVPDNGNTPQRIAGYLLLAHHASINSGIVVTGATDSASATSTTSKKPGDINEESADGTIYRVYEITVKTFNLHRIIDSYDCVSKYNADHADDIKEIIVICRKEDCPEGMIATNKGMCMGKYEHQDTTYFFWDIYEWIIYTLQHMIPTAREHFYEMLNAYINEPNTHEAVKVKWTELHN
jgi:hypothetical protein